MEGVEYTTVLHCPDAYNDYDIITIYSAQRNDTRGCANDRYAYMEGNRGAGRKCDHAARTSLITRWARP